MSEKCQLCGIEHADPSAVELAELRAKVAQLTRERDEAREDRDAWLSSANRQMERAKQAEAKLAAVVKVLEDILVTSAAYGIVCPDCHYGWKAGLVRIGAKANGALAAARGESTEPPARMPSRWQHTQACMAGVSNDQCICWPPLRGAK